MNKFLSLQPGLAEYPPLSEFTLTPPSADTNELMLNSFLFSQTINPPLQWKEKKLVDNSREYVTVFQKINLFYTSVAKLTNGNTLKYLPADNIYIAAHIYTENKILRKQYLRLVKTSNNPYVIHAYAKLYLIPRKKYSFAIKILKHAVAKKIILQAVMDLVHCYIQLKQYDNALNSLKLIPEDKYHIHRLQSLCTIYAHMNLPELFFKKAYELLALNGGLSTHLQIVDNCVKMKKYQEAWNFLQDIFEEPRNFFYESACERIKNKMDEVQIYSKFKTEQKL